jgi:hypothetical protein
MEFLNRLTPALTGAVKRPVQRVVRAQKGVNMRLDERDEIKLAIKNEVGN